MRANAAADRAAAGSARCRSRRARRGCRRSTDRSRPPCNAAARSTGSPATKPPPREHALVEHRLEARAPAPPRRRARTPRARTDSPARRSPPDRRPAARAASAADARQRWLAAPAQPASRPSRHLFGHRLVLEPPHRLAHGRADRSAGGAASRKRSFGHAHARHRILDALHRQRSCLDRADQRFERARLLVVVAAADQQAIDSRQRSPAPPPPRSDSASRSRSCRDRR